MAPTKEQLIAAFASGALWGGIVTLLAFDAFPRAIWGGLIASPMIGLAAATIIPLWSRRSAGTRVVMSLVAVYVSAALFGLAVGLCDWLVFDIPDRIPYAVVLQAVLAFMWGLTYMGLVFVFWPLAWLNYWLLSRMTVARQLTTA